MFDRLKLGTMTFNDSVDKTVDAIVLNAVTKQWKEIKVSEFYITIKLNNGDILRLWNGNKYYAWLSKGTFFSTAKGFYQWDDCRPSTRTMVLLRDKISDWYIGQDMNP
ncbi:hypothetical protein [Pectinatus frisingensis]|uniref:hypothetical protein n=1 Tax=Pectinatus frisingensis TaxID=865 RepID=UPI0018C56E25|nr:hypothetical protein [Pectinatus frisingensis]